MKGLSIMNDINTVLDVFTATCVSNGYSVSELNGNEISICNATEEVVLELDYENMEKLNINFYKNANATDEFVNDLMNIFAQVVNSETTPNGVN